MHDPSAAREHSWAGLLLAGALLAGCAGTAPEPDAKADRLPVTLEIELQRAEDDIGAGKPSAVPAIIQLVRFAMSMGRADESTRFAERALASIERGAGADSVPAANVLSMIGELQTQSGDMSAAARTLDRAAGIIARFGESADPFTRAQVHDALGHWNESSRRLDEAARHYSASIALREKNEGSDHPGTAIALESLSGVELRRGRLDAAEGHLRRALAIRERRLGSTSQHLVATLQSLATVETGRNRLDMAELYLLRALAIQERAEGPRSAVVADILAALGGIEGRRFNYERAESLLVRAFRIQRQLLPRQSPALATTLASLGILHLDQAQYLEAEPFLSEALAIREAVLPPDHPALGQSLRDLAELLRATGRESAALALDRRARAAARTDL
ncbi:MAG: tetratricopeptide repeat protein [Alphaproteobacteria bacterium]|nr:tetratricopeptide repeat protein [Alphaproteobacteria bacterium]